ncbi:MAG: hypothetical protein EPO02_02970 [Nitrospirae bacterium]|nr:MAG: hypothetical protein EPO02_02970 [Nitrospirota bacterium]
MTPLSTRENPSSARLAVAALCGFTLAFYHNLWLPGLVLIERDAFRLYLPLKQHLVERLSAGELPQWFPYDALGRPFIGVTVTGVFHPFTALYFLLPVHDAYRVSVLLCCLLAALGAFALGRTLQYSRAGAFVAGLAFALSGYMASLTSNIVYLYSLCALPLFCAALDKALTGRRAWVVAPAIIWATVFLNGDVQTGYYFGFIALFWTAARAPTPWRTAAIRLGLVAGLAALLAGVQLGPAAAVFAGSDRAQPDTLQEEALFWSTHPLRLIGLAASPLATTTDPTDLGNFFFGSPEHGLWANSLYLGIPVLGLAFLGAWHRRDVRFLALLGLLALFLALGRFGGLYDVFSRVVPLWSAFRFPEKLMGLALFAAAMLAGAGLETLREGRGRPMPWLAVALACAGVGLGLRTDASGAWAAAHFGTPENMARDVTGSAGLAFLYSALAAAGVWTVLAGVRKGHLRETLAFGALTAIVTLDLARANLGAYAVGPAEAATFVPPLAQAIAAREGTIAPGRLRMLSLRHTSYVVPPAIRHVFGRDAIFIERRQALDVAHNAQFHLESFFDYLPGRNQRLKTMMPYMVRMDRAARFNVAYYIARRASFQSPFWSGAVVAELPDYDLALARNPVPVKPRAYLSRRPERAGPAADPVALLQRPDFLSGEVDVIETSDATLPGPAHDGQAVIERYAPEEVRVRVTTPQPAVLVLLDAFDRGWTAALDDGTALPILRANGLVRAVVVPSGTHTATFTYRTPLLAAGAWASLVGLGLCGGLLVHARRETGRSRSPA